MCANTHNYCFYELYIGGYVVRVSYKKLWKLLVDLGMSKADLRKATGLATGTMTKLRKDEDISMDAIKRICIVCKCDIGDMMELIPDSEK